MSLNLPEDLKKDLFKISDSQADTLTDTTEVFPKPGLLILQHPIDGNLVIPESDLYEKYKGQILQH